MEKINIAELLKSCPSGMELDCTMYENVIFEEIVTVKGFDDKEREKIILSTRYSDGTKDKIILTEFGTHTGDETAKCVIFPKGETTWEGFVPPCKFKDGDIISSLNTSIYIFTNCSSAVDGYFFAPCGLIADRNGENHYFKVGTISISVDNMRFASEKEKQKLFDAIKENGYKWNPEIKTLEKLIEPHFKVGDKIKRIKTGNIYEIIKILSNYYIVKYLGSDIMISFNDQDEYKLVSRKFDISKLKPFNEVLVRSSNSGIWECDLFSTYNPNCTNPFHCIGLWTEYCIPYEGNEHLRGTSNDCDEYYKTWEK